MDPARLNRQLRSDPIVVTGMGVHSAAGTDVDALWQSVMEARDPATEIEIDGHGGTRACVAKEVDTARDQRVRAGRRTDRSVQLALSAAAQAADQAGVSGDGLSVIAGTSRGPQLQWEDAKAELDAGRRLRPTVAANGTVACLSGLIAQQLGATGAGFTVSATCSSGANAIALGAQQLLLGEADAVLAGGSDAPVHPLVIAGMESAGMLGSVCRPFDERRDGLVAGEGAGFLVLELEGDARRRGGRGDRALGGVGDRAQRAWAHGDPRRWCRSGRCPQAIARPGRARAGSDRLRECPRHGDGIERPCRGGGAGEVLRSDGPCQLDQGR